VTACLNGVALKGSRPVRSCAPCQSGSEFTSYQSAQGLLRASQGSTLCTLTSYAGRPPHACTPGIQCWIWSSRGTAAPAGGQPDATAAARRLQRPWLTRRQRCANPVRAFRAPRRLGHVAARVSAHRTAAAAAGGSRRPRRRARHWVARRLPPGPVIRPRRDLRAAARTARTVGRPGKLRSGSGRAAGSGIGASRLRYGGTRSVCSEAPAPCRLRRARQAPSMR
jgi:hypothetical protein